MKERVIILIVLIIAFFSITPLIKNYVKNDASVKGDSVAVTPAPENDKVFSYKGLNGIDALTLLKQKTAVEEKEPGFVVTINGRNAEEKKREFWSFYVNGKMAAVGAADFVTKDTDTIEWKLENY